MKIVICASVDLTPGIKEAKEALEGAGHEVEIPYNSQRILAGEISLVDYLAEKEKNGDAKYRQDAPEDLIKRYYQLIQAADAILVFNGDKKGIKNYIGGNAFLEMGFAHVLGKKIFLLQPLPEVSYIDEIRAMEPIIINNDFSLIN